jgi:hypothetical protein
VNAELIKMLDNAIASCSGRDIISTGEMVDMLLDMRILVLQEEQLEGADK